MCAPRHRNALALHALAVKSAPKTILTFKVQLGWFELDLGTFVVRVGKQAPVAEKARIERTLPMLNLHQCVRQRGQYITLYRQGVLDWGEVQRRAPFIAYEMDG